MLTHIDSRKATLYNSLPPTSHITHIIHVHHFTTTLLTLSTCIISRPLYSHYPRASFHDHFST